MEEVQKRLEDLEKEIRETPYHKGTEHHIGKLRAKIAILKDKIADSGGKKSGGGGLGFAVKKHGDATVVLVGFPSVGKSTLLNSLTNAHSPTAEYAFTTVTVIPGMMHYNSADIQILDVPGLIEGAAAGKGRGREVLSVVRSADLLLTIAENGHEEDLRTISEELYKNGVRLNRTPPNIEVKKMLSGGIKINSSIKQDLASETVKEICKEFRIVNAEVNLREKITIDSLVDIFARNRIWVPALFALSKADAGVGSTGEFDGQPVLAISAKYKLGLDNLRSAIWDRLRLVRVYLRRPGEKEPQPDPLIMRDFHSLLDVSRKVGNEFAQARKSAKIWGPGSRFPGQEVSMGTIVQDGMQVSFD